MSKTSRRDLLKGAAFTGVGGMPAAKNATAAPPSRSGWETQIISAN